MAKKFFYNKVYNTKRTIINAIIIGVCVIGVIICFIVVSNFEGESHLKEQGNLSIKDEVTVEINEEFDKEIFFSKIENVDLENIKVNYSIDYDISKVGEYDVNIIVDDESYPVKLIVVDTTKPDLTLKTLEIEENKTYTANDFIDSCKDNSNSECKISFYKDGVDEDGNAIDYSKYTKKGTYQIKIVAEDEAGNQTIKETTMNIGNANTGNENNNNNESTTCKYGDATYDKETYLLASNVTSNGCAISLDLYQDETITKEIDKLMETETTRIQKDVEKLNLEGTKALNRKQTAVINTSGSGVVGYELYMIVTITDDDGTKTVAEYKLNSNGKREFISNPYGLDS